MKKCYPVRWLLWYLDIPSLFPDHSATLIPFWSSKTRAFIMPFLFSKTVSKSPIPRAISDSSAWRQGELFWLPLLPMQHFCSRKTRVPTAPEQAVHIPHLGNFDRFCQVGFKEAKDNDFWKFMYYTLCPHSLLRDQPAQDSQAILKGHGLLWECRGSSGSSWWAVVMVHL